MRTLTPPFGKYAAEEAALTGEIRHAHSRLVEANEEVAFYNGEVVEKFLLERNYFGLVKHINRVLRIRLWHGIVEEGIIKWLWGSFGVSAADDVVSPHIQYSFVYVLSQYSSSLQSRMHRISVRARRASSQIGDCCCLRLTHLAGSCILTRVSSQVFYITELNGSRTIRVGRLYGTRRTIF